MSNDSQNEANQRRQFSPEQKIKILRFIKRINDAFGSAPTVLIKSEKAQLTRIDSMMPL
jgi:hypothetical protein